MTKEDIKISIIVPVYNVERFLRKCLDSLINQTYKNIEILVINDCTPDNSQNIIDEYSQKDARVVPVIHPINKGLGGARNTGIDIATGSYILFVDSDDYLRLDTVELIVNKIKLNPAVDLVKFGRVEDYGSYQIELLPTLSNDIYFDGWTMIKEALHQKKYRVAAWENAYSLDMIKNNKLYFREKLLYEDTYFTFLSTILSRKISLLNESLYFYKKDRQDSIINTVSERDVEVLTTIDMLDCYLKKINRSDILNSKEYKELIYDWVCYNVIYLYYQKKIKDKLIKNKVLDTIVNHKLFNSYLIDLSDKNIELRHRLPARLLLKNRVALSLLVKMYFLLKKLKRK